MSFHANANEAQTMIGFKPVIAGVAPALVPADCAGMGGAAAQFTATGY